MKKLFFTTFLIFFSSVIASQDIKMGLFLAPSVNSININDFENGKKKIALNYGYLIEYAFSENHFLESGFEISKKSGEINNISYKSHYFVLPIQVKMKSRPFGYLTYYAKTGPSFGVKIRDNVEGVNENLNYGEGMNLMLMLNVSIGTEYSLKQESSLFAEIFIKNGITKGWQDTSALSYETFLMNQLGVSVGFLF